MIRQPTPEPILYAWHTAALRGERPAVQEGNPQCGWYRLRLVKGGPWVPASIRCVQMTDAETGELMEPEMLVGEVAGRPWHLDWHWTWLASNPITREAYDALVEARATDARMKADLVAFDITAAPPRPARRW